ncbi:hypothetical protein HDV05_006026 [Chytridiales sp. JEL 0842]|nr:hypothetical protein HDV05_006026 [Chytridiales sp. JEL 0842]
MTTAEGVDAELAWILGSALLPLLLGAFGLLFDLTFARNKQSRQQESSRSASLTGSRSEASEREPLLPSMARSSDTNPASASVTRGRNPRILTLDKAISRTLFAQIALSIIYVAYLLGQHDGHALFGSGSSSPHSPANHWTVEMWNLVVWTVWGLVWSLLVIWLNAVVDAPLKKWYATHQNVDPFSVQTDIDNSKGLWMWIVLVAAMAGKTIEIQMWSVLHPSFVAIPSSLSSLLNRLYVLKSAAEDKPLPTEPVEGGEDFLQWLLPYIPIGISILSTALTLLLLSMESLQRYAQSTILPRPTPQKPTAEDNAAKSKEDRELEALKNRYPSPETSSSLFSRATFSFIDGLLFRGCQKPLEDEDVWNVAEFDLTKNVAGEFHKVRPRTKDGAFVASLWNMFKWRFLFVCLATVVTSLLSFTGPFFLNRIVTFLERPRDPSEPPTWEGYILLGGMLSGSVIKSVLEGNTFFIARRNAIHMRSILVSEIYGKSLRRSSGFGSNKKPSADGTTSNPDKDAKASLGKIVSLMSSDANRLYNFTSFIHAPLVSMPLEAVISVLALFYLLGPSALAGLAVIGLSGPTTALLGSRMIKGQTELSEATDARTHLTNEVLQGIKIVKYFSWEGEFRTRIMKARETELMKNIALWAYYIGFFMVAWGSSMLVILVCFFFYAVVAGNSLDAATAFTSITLLHQVSRSLNVLPMVGMQLMRAKVSLDRIADFLKEEELEKYNSSAPTSEAAEAVRNKPVGKGKNKKSGSQDETTPLLSGGCSSSVESSEESTQVALPENFHKPLIGFYGGEYCHYGSENSDKKPEAAAATPTKLSLLSRLQFWKKTPAPAPSTAPDAVTSPTTSTAASSNFQLRSVTVSFPLDSLSVITGPTGSGKTSLLLALLGELKRQNGHTFLPDPRTVPGGIAYVPQTAFLLNATIRENILFGNPYNEARYKAVIEAAALERDLEILEGGDLTEIGEKGVNLSGGQKQRISIARAAYSPSSIILLDDCLSAVDAPTARHLLKKCIIGPLMQGRTRVLVTHAASLVLPVADYVVAMKNGEVAAHGDLNAILNNPELGVAINSTNNVLEADSDTEESPPIASTMSLNDKKKDDKKDTTKEKTYTKLVDDEDRARGSVKLAVYVSYFAATGGLLFFGIFLLSYILNALGELGRDLWVRKWTEAIDHSGNETLAAFGATEFGTFAYQTTSGTSWGPVSTIPITTFLNNIFVTFNHLGSKAPMTDAKVLRTQAAAENPTTYYISIYALISLGSLFLGIGGELLQLYGSLIASRAMHAKMLDAVLGAPVRFFERTPVGRILTRFTKDLSTIDNDCFGNVAAVLRIIMGIATTLLLIAYVAPISIVVIPIILYCYYWVSLLYLSASRELKRLESVSNSPVYAQFSETLMGVSTLRAYGAETRSTAEIERKVRRVARYW